jgi:branched-chain amino acid aminotransferase
MALRGARAAGAGEALLTDDDGNILECATSNVFLVRDGELHTPPLRLGLLAGRTRSIVMERARALGLQVSEHVFPAAEACRADELFISGSVKEIVPVLRIDGRPVGDARPGPVTRRLQNAYRRGVLDSLGG